MTVRDELLKHDVIGMFELFRVTDATGCTIDEALEEATKLVWDQEYYFQDGEFFRYGIPRTQ